VTHILDAALTLYDAGFCVLPAAADGSKAPGLSTWKQYQTARPSREQTAAMVRTAQGIGVLCGQVSGNVEMLEVEGPALPLMPEVTAAMEDNGFGDVWRTILNGYAEQTPGGGIHWMFRVQGGEAKGNTKLARRPDPTPENPRGVQVLFETRGEGGWVVTAPSAGSTHPSGRQWCLVAGGVDTTPTVSADERDAVYAVLNMFDQMPVSDGPRPSVTSSEQTGDRPGDDFNAKAQWSDILDGWTVVRRMGNGYAWRRPGKNIGVSATTGQADDADRLYVFTTSTELPAETPLSKFAVYTHLHHGGDFAAAARELRRQGYGAPLNPGPTLADMVEQAGSYPAADKPDASSRSSDEKTAITPPDHIERTEDGQALALVSSVGHLIRYNVTTGRWHAYSGGVWADQAPGGGDVREYARGLARQLPHADSGAIAWRKTMLSDSGIRHVLSMASSDWRVVATSADFDSQPWLLGCGEVVTDLRAGTVRPARSEDMISKTAGTTPGSGGAGLWQDFLGQVVDADTARFLQRLFGLSLFGSVREHVLIFLFGTGANGKTTFMDALRHAAGQYAVSLPAETLMVRRHEAHSTELAPLAGARLAIFNELPDGMRFDEARVKMLTGGDQVSARWLYGQPFTFDPSHTLWIVGNAKPAAASGGEAFWRRVRLVGFHRTIPADQRDPSLPEKLRTAAPAILQWGIDGWAEYQRIGLAEPASVVADTAEYRAENDSVGRFLDECCQINGNPAVKISAPSVRAKYESWCRTEGMTAVTPIAFGLALRRAGVDQERSHGKRFYIGLTLLDAEQEESESWF
jgi:putative DNA primase/helicase